jgi:hypothetical protein
LLLNPLAVPDGRRRPKRLADASHLLHDLRTHPDEQVTSAHDRQVCVCLLSAMVHTAKQLRHRGTHPRQHPRIPAIRLARVLRDQLHPARVGNQHVVASAA